MPRFNQVLGLERHTKARAQRTLTDIHHTLLKPTLLEGIARTYEPRDESGETLPPESKRVQVKVSDAIEKVIEQLTPWFDTVAIKDLANQEANADVTLGGVTLLEGVPVTYLLFLEQRLIDLRTFIEKLPTLDPTQEWVYDANQGLYATPVVETARTKKVPRNHVKAPATDKHPAQVEVYYEDITVGTWSRRLFSGALPQARVEILRKRVEALQDAVKIALEGANTRDVTEVAYARDVLGYIFA